MAIPPSKLMEIDHILSGRIKENKFHNSQNRSCNGKTSFEEELSQKIKKFETPQTTKSFDNPVFAEHLKLITKSLQIKMNQSLLMSLSSNGDKQKEDYFSSSLSELIKTLNNAENSGFAASENRHIQKPEEMPLDKIISTAAQEHDIDPKLIRSVIRAESSFKPDALSKKGAMGLMQLMPETARELGVKDPYNPAENIMGGTKYLKMLINRYSGNLNMALAAYNWGMGNLERNPEKIPKETRDYVSRIYKFYSEAKI